MRTDIRDIRDISLIIVYYVNVDRLSKMKAVEEINRCHDVHSGKIKGALEYYIGTTTEHTRIEFFTVNQLDDITIEKLEQIEIELKLDTQ